MKNWMMQQGWGLYIMIGMAAVGVIGAVLCRIFYGRLAREAQVCGTSEYPLFHYIRQKYTSYYKLGMQPTNAKAMVRRYLSLHKVGPLSLNAYRYVHVLMAGGILLNGLIVSTYRFQHNYEAGPAIVYLGTSFILTMGLMLTGLLFGVRNQQLIAESALEDYLENYLKCRLDGEYGYGPRAEEPDNYEKALKETAAAKAGTARAAAGNEYGRRQMGRQASRAARESRETDAVDARIVEDVLKEFLC